MPRAQKEEPLELIATVNLRKATHKITFKKKAPRAVRELRKFATKTMGTKEVIISPALNQKVWSTGIRNIPTRVRVRLSRRRNEDEDAKEKMYTMVDVVETTGFSGLGTEKV
ncbi:60S ribosomal protein L31 [Hondaea fermentalgiana]|uniref:60S ribosomal protein L31 n=1 Tax=Hondaea fermentalgiana TaxID=2315210 RepID=A0A2R5GDE1_9STRA|nr:60S ribosomal protein L31 [Hondaea fermentalgiana]|eukprot:GBG28329.1 60S ribosomal protein L31 [Hondaea fermentalgiana]